MAHSGRRNFEPLYHQVEQELLRQISEGELKPGDQLPSETQLSLRFAVSRITARRAVENLIQRGLVYSRQGKGSFVAQARIRAISGFRSFTEDIRSRGLVPSSYVVDLQAMPAEPDVSEKLELTPGEDVYRLRRVRLADEKPVAFETAYLPRRLAPDLDQYDFSQRSLYEVFQTHYNLFPTWADAEIEATLATPEVAAYLQISAGDPVLTAMRLTYSESFQIIEFVKSIYCGDRFTFYTGRQYIG